MMERGVSVRCMVTWAVWLTAALCGIGGVLLDNETVSLIAVVLACAGMTLLILNDNARTRRLLRVALSEALEARERATISRVPN